MSRVITVAGSAIDRIRINSLSQEVRDGRDVWIKRRRAGSEHIARCTNLFFRLAGNPVSVCANLATWREWEVDCFQMLNGDGFHAFTDGPRSVCLERLPGESLSLHLDEGTLSDKMLEAVAAEFSRVHALPSSMFAGRWSHGDPHSGNVMYDMERSRARFIDFEVLHDRSLSSLERHADDLLVFLQDLVGRISADRWLPAATCFLRSYERRDVIEALKRRLVVPKGVPRVWWAIRTSYIKPSELNRRVALLREVIDA
jgi:hypothetical protein